MFDLIFEIAVAAYLFLGVCVGTYFLETDEEFAAHFESDGIFDSLLMFVMFALMGIPSLIMDFLYGDDSDDDDDLDDDGDFESEETITV